VKAAADKPSEPAEPPQSAAEVFKGVVQELAASPDRVELLERLRAGHEPDQHGWCRHPSHAAHWEHHPCPTLRLVTSVEHRADP
jgi:hypothetical protein